MRPGSTRELLLGIAFPPEPPVSNIVRALQLARSAGLASFTVWDHYVSFTPDFLWKPSPGDPRAPGSAHENFDYQTLLGYLAAYAGDMRIGVGVTEAIRRHPVLLAQAALTLSHLSSRPPILGLGAGERANTVPYGLEEPKPVARLQEALSVIKGCMSSSGPMTHSGHYFELDQARMDLPPGGSGPPEIWVGGRGPRMLKLTGEWADGWYPTDIVDPSKYESSLAEVRRHASLAGRSPVAITPAMELVVVFSDSDDEALRQLESPAMRLLALLAPSSVWQEHGLSHPLGEPFRGFVDFSPFDYTIPEMQAAIESVPVDLVASMVLWGTPERVATRLRSLAEAGLRHAVLSLSSEDVVHRATFTSRALQETARLVGR